MPSWGTIYFYICLLYTVHRYLCTYLLPTCKIYKSADIFKKIRIYDIWNVEYVGYCEVGRYYYMCENKSILIIKKTSAENHFLAKSIKFISLSSIFKPSLTVPRVLLMLNALTKITCETISQGGKIFYWVVCLTVCFQLNILHINILEKN